MGDNSISTFLLFYSIKMSLSSVFLHSFVCLCIDLEKLHFGQLCLFVFVKLLNLQNFFTGLKALSPGHLVVQMSSTKFQSMSFTMKI